MRRAAWAATRLAALPSGREAGARISSAAAAGAGAGTESAQAAAGVGELQKAAAGAVPEPSPPDRVAKVLAHSFHKAPRDTAVALVQQLHELDKVHLVLALQEVTKRSLREKEQTQYVDDLVKQVTLSDNKQHSKLTRQQIESAIVFQRNLQKFQPVSERPLTWRETGAVGLAAGAPFVAFGFLDNGIMLVAGEQIDSLFGARMGLTMMASAGLGNLVADVVGVSATHSVQDLIKRLGWVKPPPLSMLQQQQRAVRWAKLVGGAAGVAVGCVLGMTPLLFMEPGFFVGGGGAAADLASHTAAALGGLGDSAAAVAPLGGGGGAAEQVAAAAAAPAPAPLETAAGLPPDAAGAAAAAGIPPAEAAAASGAGAAAPRDPP